MHEQYLSIKNPSSVELIIDKSRFICSIERVSNEAHAIEFIKKINKTHYNATHNCFAYIIGKGKEYQRQSDDGEPSGTAGIPMIEVLRKNNLTDTVCVVTRYFGGIKLGAGGLIRAYSSSVSQAIAKAGIIEMVLMNKISITFDYSLIGLIESRLSNYQIKAKEYLTNVTYDVLVNSIEKEQFKSWIIDLTNNRVIITDKGTEYIQVDYQREQTN